MPITKEQVVEDGPAEGTQAREENLIVGGKEHVHVVELHEAQPPDGGAHVARVDAPRRARTIKALGGESDAPGFREGQIGHRRIPASTGRTAPRMERLPRPGYPRPTHTDLVRV